MRPNSSQAVWHGTGTLVCNLEFKCSFESAGVVSEARQVNFLPIERYLPIFSLCRRAGGGQARLKLGLAQFTVQATRSGIWADRELLHRAVRARVGGEGRVRVPDASGTIACATIHGRAAPGSAGAAAN